MVQFSTILTHPGGAHKDEFLACCVLVSFQAVPIVRCEPSPADLADPTVCVVDVGHEHDPDRNNFDHHQLPKDHPPTCSLSLVLRHLGLYEDARRFCEWLESAEWFDCRGAVTTARWLGVAPEVLPKLNSPIDLTLLRRFAAAKRVAPGEPLWEMMRMIGDDLVGHIRTLRDRLAFVERHVQTWTVDLAGKPAKILFLPRIEPLGDEPSLGLEEFIKERGLAEEIVGLVYPDRRSTGYGLSRFRDNPRLDFTRLAGEPDVHFAHSRGFVAKTSAHRVERLQAMIGQAAASA